MNREQRRKSIVQASSVMVCFASSVIGSFGCGRRTSDATFLYVDLGLGAKKSSLMVRDMVDILNF